MKCSLSTFPETVIQKSAAFGKTPPSSTKWGLQGHRSLTPAGHLLHKKVSTCLTPLHDLQQQLQTYWAVGKSVILPCTLNSAQDRVHTHRQTHANPTAVTIVPLSVDGCWLACGAHSSASVLGWVQAGGPRYWCWWECFSVLLSFSISVVFGTKPPFFPMLLGSHFLEHARKPWRRLV